KGGRYRLARADAQPARHWPVAIPAEPDGNVRAMVGVRGELRPNLPILQVRAVRDLGGLWAFLAGGWLALRHLDVLLNMHRRSRRWRKQHPGGTDARDQSRQHGTTAPEGLLAKHDCLLSESDFLR